jgi:hypothetical protein
METTSSVEPQVIVPKPKKKKRIMAKLKIDEAHD